MADLNARIKPKKSSTAGEIPQASDLEVAELAVNTADGKLFVKHTDNSIKEISGSGGGGGGGTATVIVPFGQGYVDNISSGTGTGLTWGAWNSGSGNIVVTFDTAQPNADYSVITDNESADDIYVSVSSKTTTGFTLSTYDFNGNPTSPATYPFVFQAYASDPTVTVGNASLAGVVIDDLTDVDTSTTAPTNGQVLEWNGSNWVPATPSVGATAINDLTDVDTSTVAPSDGQVLSWDNANSQWEPSDLQGGAVRTALGIGEYADDAAAGTGGVASGALYYNTTSSDYRLKT